MSQGEGGKLCSFENESFRVGAWYITMLLAHKFVLVVERKATFISASKLLHKLELLCFSEQIQNTFQCCSRVKILCKRDDWEDINRKDVILPFYLVWSLVFSPEGMMVISPSLFLAVLQHSPADSELYVERVSPVILQPCLGLEGKDFQKHKKLSIIFSLILKFLFR